MAGRRAAQTEPRILEMPSQKMAVVRAKGAPEKVVSEVRPALSGSVYTLKFDLKKKGMPAFKVGPPRGRYPDANLVPKEGWTIILGLPISDDVTSLPQKVPGVEVRIEAWDYGTVAQILHLGPYSEEGPTVERLHKFIKENGHEIAGMHEEEYLTSPEAKVPRTIVRYPVRKRQE